MPGLSPLTTLAPPSDCRPRSMLRLRLVLLSLTLLLFGCSGVAPVPEQRFRLHIAESGVYRLEFEDLRRAGLDAPWVPSARLRLEVGGDAVPIHVADGGDGRFGPGDWIEFFGQRLRGSNRHNHPFQDYNVYWLSFVGTPSPRLRPLVLAPDRGQTVALRRVLHLERDEMMIRISGRDTFGDPDPELWYWAKMTFVDREPVEVAFDLPDLDAELADQAVLELRFRSLSEPPYHLDLGGIGAHMVLAELNGHALEPMEWSGKRPIDFRIDALPAGLLREHGNRLRMRVPPRIPPGAEMHLVDVVMFDFLRVDYPARGRLEAGGGQLRPATAPGVAVLYAPRPLELVAIDRKGRRQVPVPVAEADGRWRYAVALTDPAPGALAIGFLDAPLRPKAVIARRPVDLSRGPQADYLMIAHPRLIDAVRPLADYHRARGLSVALVDVDDVYDGFGHGIVHPQAIRDFIAHTVTHWPSPAPRFVLLVGDASWDVRSEDPGEARYADWAQGNIGALLLEGQFPDHGLPRYSQTPELGHRNLIPTWQFMSHEGHSAADNWFVALDPDSFHPQLAIGRFPVVEPEEVSAIVAKTIAYAEASDLGPWRRNALWITEDNDLFREISNALAGQLAEAGLAATMVYPSEHEPDHVLHQTRLVEAFDAGQLVVHFIGHGGRHIWRTGAPDPLRNHDLFTLDHVAGLDNGGRLPLVLSMTCYSAPFDHPSVDSIGEKFLRQPGAGAVAVLAASWRNSPTQAFSERVLAQLMDPELTIGEAIMRAKQGEPDRTLVETYNLLGDPALRLLRPRAELELEPLDPWRYAVRSSQLGAAEALADWLDEHGRVLASHGFALRDGQAVLDLREVPPPAAAQSLRVYAWDLDSRLDAAAQRPLGALEQLRLAAP